MTITGTPVVNCTGTTGTSVQTRNFTAGAHGESQAISVNINSGTSAVDIFRLATTSGSYKDVTFSSTFTGTLQIANNIFVYGNFDVGGVTAYTFSASTAIITFGAASGTQNINFRSTQFGTATIANGVVFGVAGSTATTYVLTNGFTALSTATITTTLTAGTLNLNNFTLTTNLFSSSNSNTRVLAFGTGKIVLTATSGTLFTTSTATGLTVTGTSPLIQATAGGAGTRTITMGAAGETNAISLDVTAGSDIISLSTTSGAYKNVNFTGFTGTVSIQNSIFVFGNWNYGGTTIQGVGTGTVTFAATSGTKTITSNGFSFPGNVTFNGVGGTWALQDAMTVGSTVITTLTNGTLDLNGYTLTTGSFYSSNTNLRVLAFGTGKIVVTSNNSAPINFDTATNFSYTGTSNFEAYYTGAVGVRYFDIGDIAGGSEAVAMNLKVTAGTDTVYIYIHWNNVDFTGFSGTLGNLGSKILYGSLTLSSGMFLEQAALQTITFAATSGPKTITSAGNTIDYPVTFDGVGGTWAMQDAFTLGSTRTLTFTNGTVQLKSGTTSTVNSFVTTGTNQKYLQATTPGTQATISQASGTDSVTYLHITDSSATGGAVWDATSTTNTNGGNNTGWLFTKPPVSGFFTFF